MDFDLIAHVTIGVLVYNILTVIFKLIVLEATIKRKYVSEVHLEALHTSKPPFITDDDDDEGFAGAM
jgi:hypothetical protein